jgi:hypothetical protein
LVRSNVSFLTKHVTAPWRVFLICVAGNALLRLPSFFRTVLDWDESLYALMARQWLAGHLPYTTIWDNKPVGIYAIFALFEAVFGNPVIAMRAATVMCVSCLCVVIWRLAHVLLVSLNDRAAGRLAWLAVLSFMLGALSNDGLSANTELFMEGFSAAALLAAIDPVFCAARPIRRAACVGLLFSLACMIKYVAVFEAPAAAFALLAMAPDGPGPGWRAAAVRCAAAAAGALLVPGLTIAAYAAAGQLPLWWACAIASNVTRVAAPFSVAQLHAVAFIILPRWAPAVIAGCVLIITSPFEALGLFRRRPGGQARRPHVLLALWLLGGGLGAASAKTFYDHYFLQILPPACLALALLAGRAAPSLAGGSRWRAGLLAALLLIAPANAGYGTVAAITPPWRAGAGFAPDTPARIAALLRPQIAAGASLYVFDSQPIIYALTGAVLPTRFVLPSVLTRCFLARVAGVDAPAEVARILSTDPDFVIAQTGPLQTPDPAVYTAFNAAMTRYGVWQQFPDAVIYRLRPGATRTPIIPLPDDCP